METVNQDNNTTTTTQEEARTFTQAEVDAIVGDRLQRERTKYADYADLKQKADLYDQQQEANKTELQKANDRADALQKQLTDMKAAETVRTVREKVATETGVPVHLLTATTEEDCKAQADAIKAYAQPGAYPTVPDGGEPQGRPKQSTAQQFANWFNTNF